MTLSTAKCSQGSQLLYQQVATVSRCRTLLRFPSQPECDDREYVLRPLPLSPDALRSASIWNERTADAPLGEGEDM